MYVLTPCQNNSLVPPPGLFPHRHAIFFSFIYLIFFEIKNEARVYHSYGQYIPNYSHELLKNKSFSLNFPGLFNEATRIERNTALKSILKSKDIPSLEMKLIAYLWVVGLCSCHVPQHVLCPPNPCENHGYAALLGHPGSVACNHIFFCGFATFELIFVCMEI